MPHLRFNRGKSSVHAMGERAYVEGKIAKLEKELADRDALAREVERQIADGVKPSRAHTSVHRAAFKRMDEIKTELARLKRRLR